jgi:hypothetical protein
MVDHEVYDRQLKVDRFPFKSEGEITLAVRNADYTLGPVMLHIVMKPGAAIPAHHHDNMAEALYVAEGDFINEGKEYQVGIPCISKLASRTAHIAPRMAANYWCSGQNVLPTNRQTSATLLLKPRQP